MVSTDRISMKTNICHQKDWLNSENELKMVLVGIVSCYCMKQMLQKVNEALSGKCFKILPVPDSP